MPRHGENIRKRKDGRWEGRYYAPGSQPGRNVPHSVYARTYGELKEKLLVLKAKMEEASADTLGQGEKGTGPLFSTAAEEWLVAVENDRKHATYMKYRIIYEKHLREKLGSRPFPELGTDILTEVFRTDGEMLSGSLQKSILCVLNQILSYAAQHYHTGLPRYSCQGKKAAPKPIEVLEQAELARLLQELYGKMDIYKLGIILCLSTGLRLGEICSLKWRDIDLERKILHVNTTVQRIAVDGHDTKTVLWEGEPKSTFSKRQIPLSEELVKLLLPYRKSVGEYFIKGKKPMEPRTYQNKFQKYLEASGVKRKNFHILRHTFATNCIENGTDVKSLSEILGHSDVNITLNRYVHPTTETKRQHMDSLFSIYGQFACRQ